MLTHALDLAARGFHVFPILPMAKTPRVKGWQQWATTDADKIRAHWSTHPNDNVGISTSHNLLVVDIDVKEGKDGYAALLRHELEGNELPDTFAQRTPSGGRHLVYRVDAPVRQGVDVLGVGLDVRSKGGYVVGAGSVVDAGAYGADEAPIADAPEWIVSLCGKTREKVERPGEAPANVDRKRAEERAAHYLFNEAPIAVQGQGGDETTYKVAARVKDLGCDFNQADMLMAQWNELCDPPWDPDELSQKIRNAYKYGNEPPGSAAPEAMFEAMPDVLATDENLHPFAKLNRHFAWVIAGGGSHILWETHDENGNATLMHLDESAFHKKFAAHKMMVGRQEKPVTQLWMESKERRSYDGIVFAPGRPAPERFYNLWRGFAFEPAAAAHHPALDAFLEHARENVCGGDEKLYRWLIGYFAHLVQRPWDKPLVALVFRGAKGVGKNALVERVGALLGPHFLLASNRRYLVGNFNSHLENCLMFTLDEAFWSGDKQSEGVLKDLITGSQHLVEHKNKTPYRVANRTRVVVVGNEDWLVPASHDERRFAVFDVGDGRKQDRRFFEDMRLGMEAGGYAHLLRFLLDHPISDVNDAPLTQALADQKEESLDPFPRWWLGCLERGYIPDIDFSDGWPAEVDCDALREAFGREVKRRNIRNFQPDERSIGRTLARITGGAVVKFRKGRDASGKQPYAYKMSVLEVVRAAWVKFTGQPREWG